MLDLSMCRKLMTDVHIDAQRSGLFGPGETFDEVNRISRATIRAFKREKSTAWLGKINLYSQKDCKTILVPYMGGMVQNFSCIFVVPKFDQKLVDMIMNRYNSPSEGMSVDIKHIDRISDRIDRLGGIHLHWV